MFAVDGTNVLATAPSRGTPYFSSCIFALAVSAFFKENVRYLEWTCRDPISLILGTR